MIFPMRKSIGLYDSNEAELKIGDYVKCHTSNTDVHGQWVIKRIMACGCVLYLAYVISEKGFILPLDYTRGYLTDQYESKGLLMRDDENGVLIPYDHMVVIKERYVKTLVKKFKYPYFKDPFNLGISNEEMGGD